MDKWKLLSNIKEEVNIDTTILIDKNIYTEDIVNLNKEIVGMTGEPHNVFAILNKSDLEEDVLLEATKYDNQAVEILNKAKLFIPELNEKIIQLLYRGDEDNGPDIHAFTHAPNWAMKYLKGIARMLVEYANGSQERAQEFLTELPMVFEPVLTWIKKNRTEKNAKEIDDNIVNKFSFDDLKKFLDEIQSGYDKESEQKLAKIDTTKKSNYELIPINKYKDLAKFGHGITGNCTNDKSAWCHAYDEDVYNGWMRGGKYKMYVLAVKNYQDIKPIKEKNSPKDEYGLSLIALRVTIEPIKLINATLRWNHINIKSNFDNQFTSFGVLSEVVGFNVKAAIEKDLEETQKFRKEEIKTLDTFYYNKMKDTGICDEETILEDDRNIITTIIIPDNIKEIDDSAFYKCFALKSITIPDSVRQIGVLAFAQCLSLTTIIIPDSVQWLGPEAFISCKALTSIIIPDSVVGTGSGVFRDCTSLKSIIISKSMANLEVEAFRGCRALTSISIPDSVTRLGLNVFAGCKSLNSIKYDNKEFKTAKEFEDYFHSKNESIIVLNKKDLEENIQKSDLTLPKYLYHATFKPRVASIKKYGLGGKVPKVRSYDYKDTSYESIKQGVFLATDYNIAYSYAEIAFEDIDNPPEWADDIENNIVVFAVLTDKLDNSLIKADTNIIEDESTLFYNGIIPFNLLINVKDNISEKFNTIKETKKKTLNEDNNIKQELEQYLKDNYKENPLTQRGVILSDGTIIENPKSDRGGHVAHYVFMDEIRNTNKFPSILTHNKLLLDEVWFNADIIKLNAEYEDYISLGKDIPTPQQYRALEKWVDNFIETKPSDYLLLSTGKWETAYLVFNNLKIKNKKDILITSGADAVRCIKDYYRIGTFLFEDINESSQKQATHIRFINNEEYRVLQKNKVVMPIDSDNFWSTRNVLFTFPIWLEDTSINEYFSIANYLNKTYNTKYSHVVFLDLKDNKYFSLINYMKESVDKIINKELSFPVKEFTETESFYLVPETRISNYFFDDVVEIKSIDEIGKLNESVDTEFKYKSLDDLLPHIENEILALTEVKKAVVSSFKNIAGPSYLTPNGTIIDIEKYLAGKVSPKWISHREFIEEIFWTYFQEDKIISSTIFEDEDLMAYLENDAGFIRLNNGSLSVDARTYLVLINSIRPTENQYNKIIEFIEMNNRSEVMIYLLFNRETVKTIHYNSIYSTDNESVDDLIKRIKRWYTTGSLVEEINKTPDVGYRNNFISSQIVKLKDIIKYEVFELGNIDILDRFISYEPYKKELDNKTLQQLKQWVDDQDLLLNDDITEDEQDNIINTLLKALNKATGKRIQYGLWLASADVIMELYEGEKGKIAKYNTSDVILSDLGFDDQGVLYGYETNPYRDSQLQEDNKIDKNTFMYKGKKYWSGSVSLLDGEIEEVHTYKQAKKADFHHSHYFSIAQVEKMDLGEAAFFFVDNNGIIYVNPMERVITNKELNNIKNKIKQQIKIITLKLDESLQDKDSEGNSLTPEQLEFFKGSKVRDEQDKLLVVYHGSSNKFNEFKYGDIGFHFGNIEHAGAKGAQVNKYYLNLKNPYRFIEDIRIWDGVMGFTLWLISDYGFPAPLTDEEKNYIKTNFKGLVLTIEDILNPSSDYFMDKLTEYSAEELKEYLLEILWDWRVEDATPYNHEINVYFRKLFMNRGYDGIIYPNEYEYEEWPTHEDSYIIFNTNQAKLIDNKTPTTSNRIDESKAETIRLITRQTQAVKDMLKQGETYIADYNKMSFAPQYKALAEFYNMKNPPIFLIPEDRRSDIEEISGIKGMTDEQKTSVPLILNVPLSEIHIMEYYSWGDFIYFTKEEDPDWLSLSKEEALEHIDLFIKKSNKAISRFNVPQVITDRIEPEWVVSGLDEELSRLYKTELEEAISTEDQKLLAVYDKKFGQDDLYMWSTYILPNGHFLNPENAIEDKEGDYWDGLSYEHEDFQLDSEDIKDINTTEDVLEKYCIKMNVTYPYLFLPREKVTPEQLDAIKKIFDRIDLLQDEGYEYDGLMILTHNNKEKLYTWNNFDKRHVIKDIIQSYSIGFI